MSRDFRDILRFVSLTPKMLVLTVLAGVLVWAALDFFQTRKLRQIMESDLMERLRIQALEDRIHFDNYIQSFHQAVKLIVSGKAFSEFERGLPPDPGEVRTSVLKIPPWLPDSSVLRRMAHFEYAFLLDRNDRLREIYQLSSVPPPAGLVKPGKLLRALSLNQSYLTSVDGKPFLITTESLKDGQGRSEGSLMTAEQLNDNFLLSSQVFSSHENLIALIGGDPPRFLASSRPDLLPAGTPVEELGRKYLIIGKSFFDWGASELQLEFASLIPKREFERLNESMIALSRRERIITSLALIASFTLIMYWITGRIQRLTKNINSISAKIAGAGPRPVPGGDQLITLENEFQRFSAEIVESREKLRRQAEELLKEKTIYLDNILQSSPLGIIAVDRAYCVKYYNSVAGKFFGCIAGQVRGKFLRELCAETDPPWSIFEKAGPGVGGDGYTEITELGRGEDILYLESLVCPILDSKDAVIGFLLTSQDVSYKIRAEVAIREREMQLAESQRIAKIGSWQRDLSTGKAVWSDELFRIFGFDPKAIRPDYAAFMKIIHPDDRERLENRVRESIDQKRPYNIDYRIIRENGDQAFIRTLGEVLLDESGRPCLIRGTAQDITVQKQMEEDLAKSGSQLRAIVDTEPECVKLLARDGTLLDMNPAGLAMVEAESLDQVSGKEILSVIAPGYRDEYRRLTERTFGGESGGMEFELIGLKGTRRWMETRTAPLRNPKNEIYAMLAVTRDITERKKAEEKTISALREKELLIQEVHHRVKNNLQIIASLLYLQAENISDPRMLALFKESRDRIKSMALVHEKLYGAKDLSRVDVGSYIDGLTAYLFQSHGAAAKGISRKMHLDDFTIGLNLATPCGLIVNELVSNALKYAFQGRSRGTVEITARFDERNGAIELGVEDDGVGLPEDIDIASLKSLGLRLVQNLVQQLHGKIRVGSGKGVSFRIVFPVKDEKK